MAKSIRSKIKKRHRAVMRSTVGEAQVQKNLRQAVRRLKRSLEEQTAGAPGVAAAVPDVAGPPRTKALRYTFNTRLRAERLATDLEDVTDDEDEVRLADKVATAQVLIRSLGGGGAEDEAMGGAGAPAAGSGEAEESGVTKAPRAPEPKRKKGERWRDALRDGHLGLYDTDEVFDKRRKKGGARATRGKAKLRFWSR